MKLEGVVKYANVAYAGLMIGIAAYVVVLLKNGYYFVPNTQTVSYAYVISSDYMISNLLAVMIVATIFIVLLNLYYEHSLTPPPRQIQRKTERKSKSGKK